MPELLLCISQDEIKTPYQFKVTGINVYSFEEAAYHCYHHWKQSIDDFMSEDFLEWVRDVLGLSFLASRIKSLWKLTKFSDRFIGFLSIIDYFDEMRLTVLKTQLIEWEARLEWERLKERADYLLQKKDPQRAYTLYRQALSYDENAELLNNLAVALMKLEHYAQAEIYFERALAAKTSLEHYDQAEIRSERALAAKTSEDPHDNLQLLLNLSEAAIYSHNFARAEQCLREAEAIEPDSTEISYLYGELNIETGNIRHSIECFEKALNMKYDPQFIYRIAETYVRLRKYDQALEALTKIKDKDTKFLTHQASIYASANNMPAAVKCIERALLAERGSASLWTLMAQYHRRNYDLTRADAAIIQALTLSPDDDNTKLEDARIKKAQGKMKDYQTALHGILIGFKRKYRDFM